MLLIKHSIRHDHVYLRKTSKLETVAAYLHLPDQRRLLIVSGFHPPGNTLCPADLDTVFSSTDPAILLGDLNSKHPAWNCHHADRNGHILLDYCLERSVMLNHPNQPTYVHPRGSASILDIALTKGCHISSPTSIMDLSSDHNPVLCELRVLPLMMETRTVMDYTQAHWTLYHTWLNHLLAARPSICNSDDLDREVQYFTAAVLQASTAAIPRREIKRRHLSFPPSFCLLKIRNYVRRRFQRSGLNVLASLLSALNWLSVALQQRLQTSKWTTLLRTLHPHKAQFWKLARYF